ncbi:MAG: hypothetical protein H0T89_16180 [Deltaproteobacteria bacterium]|nr:hypothetical protein [Deltaproteobacteria bacterium]MDQ3295260.1 hypothetical protein [Myxococcota bacterium]
MWKHATPILLLFACSSEPAVLVARTTGTIALDAPLEFQFAASVDTSVLDGLVLQHDGIRETGKVTVEANVARFWPDHGWYAGTTYDASLDDVEDEAGAAIAPWTFASHGAWRVIAGVAPGCGADDWTPRATTTLDGSAWLVGHAGGRTCIARHTAAGWQPASVLGTAAPAGSTIFASTLHVAEDGRGFAIHTVDTRAELVDVGGTLLARIDGLDDFGPPPSAAVSPAGRGLVVWERDAADPAARTLLARRYDAGVLGAETMIARGDGQLIGVAASDAGVVAVAWITYDASGAIHLMLAIDRGDGAWQPHEVKKVAINSFAEGRLAVDEAGWVYLAWIERVGTATHVWSAAESREAKLPPARIDSNGVRSLRTDLALVSRSAHTRVAWLEKAEERRLGVVPTRTASAGMWTAAEESPATVEPYLELEMAIDGLGNPAFTWKDGQLSPCGVRKIGATWTSMCGLPRPNFTAPTPGISVNARGRAFVSFYTGVGVGVATFD